MTSPFRRPRYRPPDVPLCQDLSRLRKPGTLVNQFRYGEIIKSAAAGCELCCILRDASKPFVTDGKEPTKDTVLDISLMNSGLRVHYFSGRQDVEIFSLKDVGVNAIPRCNIISDHTGSEAGFMRAVEWFLKCLNNHRDLCATMSSSERFLPHRVLDLETGSGNNIVLRDTHNQAGKYACLSHRWGNVRPLTTTRENISDHMRGIEWTNLPKTFQEVITFVRRLTIRYLWIDSLCIIQNDMDDWNLQSSLMADIYRNALITISASASNGPHDGLFFPAKEEHVHRELSRFNKRTDCRGIYVRKPIYHAKSHHPLLGRGWVFQERLLSPRILHFGPGELIWECIEDTTCECCGIHTRGLDGLDAKTRFHPYVLAALPSRECGDSWRSVVKDYTKLKLTCPEDMLPAISGAAKVMAEAMKLKGLQSKYLAGMWERCFIEDCLWTTNYPMESYRPAEWRAPTFSWASVVAKYGVEYRMADIFVTVLGESEDLPQNEQMTPSAKLLYSSCVLAEEQDAMGRVASGYITLSGSLLEATVHVGEENLSIDSFYVNVHGQRNLQFPGRFFADYNLTGEGKYQVDMESTVWCLKLVSLRLLEWKRQYLFCLVLKQVEIDGEHVYERIGLLKYQEGLEPPIERWFGSDLIEEYTVVKII
ncbi:HET-domain-containing protein [Zopfia rhizophila CBS 207.26]|uniref:HET-domain-containing protein n=1 Tax=Zopfia rhizophila CBS 207.26 TaxID=1314779 RepID=A0A6A6E0E5_9PEZI|nr:HET-domain-containing protein [Zopfia rhizophila CBS 207.26]